jgi:hypothetical protein
MTSASPVPITQKEAELDDWQAALQPGLLLCFVMASDFILLIISPFSISNIFTGEPARTEAISFTDSKAALAH